VWFCPLASVDRGIGSSPLSCSWASCICSKTLLISTNLFLIIPLWFLASSYYSATRSCTLSVTRSTSSLVIVYYRICLWTFAFLSGPPICMISHLGGPISCGVVFNEIPCAIVSPLPSSSYVEALSLFPIFPSFFGVFPFFYCAIFGLCFVYYVSLLVAMLPPTDFLNDPASTYFPFSIS
jgi:hypothetical protein